MPQKKVVKTEAKVFQILNTTPGFYSVNASLAKGQLLLLITGVNVIKIADN